MYHVPGVWSSRAQRILGCTATLLTLTVTSPVLAPPGHAAQFGEITLLTSVPATPGFPEGIAVHGHRVYVSGPATPGTAGTGASKLFVYNRNTGGLETEIVVAGENTNFEHALSCNAVDDAGRLYVLSAQLFAPPFAQMGLLRFTRQGDTYIQETYTTPFPTLPTCAFGPLPVSCALPNDLAFAEDGTIYVTDSLQATIWRIPPGGGTPQVWFQSALLAGGGSFPIGVNGIRLAPDRTSVYVSVTFSASDPGVGKIYRLPLVDTPDEADLVLWHEYTAGEGPDGLAFGASGRLYVALAGANQLSVLAPDGTEVARIASDPDNAMPLDAPANIAFDHPNKALLVTNRASVIHPAHFAVLRVFVDDTADPLAEPVLP